MTENEASFLAACLKGNVHFVQLALEDGEISDVNFINAEGKTLADFAVTESFGNNIERRRILKTLIQWGLDWSKYPDHADFKIAAGQIGNAPPAKAASPEKASKKSSPAASDKFRDFIRNAMVGYLKEVPESIAKDSYALSVFLFEDTSEELGLWIGVHTETQVKARMAGGSSADEARWNFPIWEQGVTTPDWGNDNNFTLLEYDGPPEGVEAREAWLRANGWWNLDSMEDEEEAIALDDKARSAFWKLVTEVAVSLREEGLIDSVFSADLAIAIHETHCSGDETVEATSKANPDGQAADFIRCCRGETPD